MTTYTDGLNSLYPINFMALNKLTESIQDLDAILLFSKIKFHEMHSKLTLKNGMKCITRTRETMAKWFGFGLGKLDRLLKLLEEKELIEIQKRLWYGKKQLFIATSQEENYAAINTKLFNFLTAEAGCVKSAVLLARIAFALRNTKIVHDGQKWCSLTRVDIAKLLSTSLRTTDAIIQKLINKNLILAQNLVFKKKRRLHFCIPEETLKRLSLQAQAIMTEDLKNEQARVEQPQNKPPAEAMHSHFCRFPLEEPAKIEVPIILSTNSLKENNNTSPSPTERKKIEITTNEDSDINLNTINEKLTARQLLFLRAALRKTITGERLTISNEQELFEELQYSILNPQQRRAVTGFKHAVSRCMQLLRQRNWRTPFGFHRHTEYGKALQLYRERQLQAHEARKRQECHHEYKLVPQSDSHTIHAIRWAQQLTRYSKEAQKEKGNTTDLRTKIEFAASRVLELINLGADRLAIKPHLPADMNR